MKHVLSIVCAALLASLAAAQGTGAPPAAQEPVLTGSEVGHQVSRETHLQLIQRADVQEDLKFTDEQKSRAQKLQQDYMTSMQQSLQAVMQRGQAALQNGQITREQYRALLQEEVQRVRANIDRQGEAEANKILTTEQRRRLGEIKLQLLGDAAFQSPRVLYAISAERAVRSRIEIAVRTRDQALTRADQQLRAGRITREQFQNERMMAESKLEEDMKALITDGMRAKLKEVAGPVFKGAGQATTRPGGRQSGGRGSRGGRDDD